MARGQLSTEDAQAADHDERDAALAAWGLKLEGDAPQLPAVYLWPENLPTFQLWHLAQSSLRHGMQGAEGIDYGALHAMVSRTRCMRLPASPRRRASLWADLRIVESTALQEWAAKRAQG